MNSMFVQGVARGNPGFTRFTKVDSSVHGFLFTNFSMETIRQKMVGSRFCDLSRRASR